MGVGTEGKACKFSHIYFSADGNTPGSAAAAEAS